MAILALTSPLPAEPYLQALRRAAPDIRVWGEADAHDPAQVEAILAWRMPDGVLPRYPSLRVLASIGAGVDKLLAAADLPANVMVTRVVDPGQGVEIAQYTVAVTLGFTRGLGVYAAQQAARVWRRHPVRAAAQCRVGVLGMGEVGRAIASAFAPLGYPVAGWSRRPREVMGVDSFAGADALQAFLARSNVLVCALPLTAETRGLLNRATLTQLPRGAFVVNIGRGENLAEADLRALLDEGHLGGAALDVFEREPIPADNWVWRHPRVVATPHIAAQASFDTVAAQCIDALRRARDGRAQLFGVDRNAGY